MPANFANQTIWTGDNLDILRGMNSECADLIYLDPPFNSNKNYAAPIGSEAAGAAFKDTWTLSDVDEAWHGEIADREPALYAILDASGQSHGKGMKSYLIMMAVRLLEMRRVLKDTGSIYLHCDPTASHYLKLLMDAVFGVGQFRNEVIWAYRKWSMSPTRFMRNHDAILFYGKDSVSTFNIQYVPVSEGTFKRWKGKRQDSIFRDGVRYQVSTEDQSQSPCPDWWIVSVVNPNAKERIGYPTQKPLALLERIIKASSNEGDMVLDPFAGCATACVAAEKLGRQWVGIDISPKAADLVELRLQREIGLFWQGSHRTDIPQRTDLGELPSYRTHKHTLFGKQEGLCAGCKVLFPFRNFTVDHMVPQSKSGTDHIDNLQLLCNACNSMKGVGTQEQFIAKLRVAGIRS